MFMWGMTADYEVWRSVMNSPSRVQGRDLTGNSFWHILKATWYSHVSCITAVTKIFGGKAKVEPCLLWLLKKTITSIHVFLLFHLCMNVFTGMYINNHVHITSMCNWHKQSNLTATVSANNSENSNKSTNTTFDNMKRLRLPRSQHTR